MKPSLETLEAIADRYLAKHKNMVLAGSPYDGSNFIHRIGGLMTPIIGSPKFTFENWNFCKPDYKKSLRGLRLYFRLLEEVPEYRTAELHTGEGMLGMHFTPPPEYVKESYKRLKEQGLID